MRIPARYSLLALAAALFLPAGAASQQTPDPEPTDSILIQVEGRPVRGEIVRCDQATGYAGDTIRCVLRAYDAQGVPTAATYFPTSSNPDVLTVGALETAADSAVVTVILSAPGAAYLRVAVRETQVGLGIINDAGGPAERFRHLDRAPELVDGMPAFPATVAPGETFRLCAYLYAGDGWRVAKSAPECPGDLPVLPATWENRAPQFIFPAGSEPNAGEGVRLG